MPTAAVAVLPFLPSRPVPDASVPDPDSDPVCRGDLSGMLARGDVWRGDRLARGRNEVRPSGFPVLDAELPGGGWPGGALVDLMHARPGIGELALLLPAVAAATAVDEWVFLLAPPYRVFAPAWQAAGVRLSRLVVLDAAVAGRDGAGGRCPADTLWAAEQVLRAGSAAIVLLWLPRTVNAEQVRRLQVAAEAGGSTGFFLQDESRLAQPSAAPLRLRLAAQRPGGEGSGAADGLAVSIVKRRGAPLAQALVFPLSGVPLRPAPAVDDRAGGAGDCGDAGDCAAVGRPGAPGLAIVSGGAGPAPRTTTDALDRPGLSAAAA